MLFIYVKKPGIYSIYLKESCCLNITYQIDRSVNIIKNFLGLVLGKPTVKMIMNSNVVAGLIRLGKNLKIL